LVKLAESGSTIFSISLSLLLFSAADLAASEDRVGVTKNPPYQASTTGKSNPQQTTNIAQPTQEVALVRLTVPYAFKLVNADLQRAQVECALYTQDAPPANLSASDAIYTGNAEIYVQGIDTTGEVEVFLRRGPMTFPKGHPTARSYQCWIWIVSNGTESTVVGTPSDNYKKPAWSIAAPNSTLRVKGLLN